MADFGHADKGSCAHFQKLDIWIDYFCNLKFGVLSLFGLAFFFFLKKMVLIFNISSQISKYQWAESQHFSWEDLRYPKRLWLFWIFYFLTEVGYVKIKKMNRNKNNQTFGLMFTLFFLLLFSIKKIFFTYITS